MQVATRDGHIFGACAKKVAKGAAREAVLPPGRVLFWWSGVARMATNMKGPWMAVIDWVVRARIGT